MLSLRYDAEAIVSYLFAVGDGFALQALSDPERDISAGARRRRRLGPATCSSQRVTCLTDGWPPVVERLADQPMRELMIRLAGFLGRRRRWVLGGWVAVFAARPAARLAPDRSPHRRRLRRSRQPVEGGQRTRSRTTSAARRTGSRSCCRPSPAPARRARPPRWAGCATRSPGSMTWRCRRPRPARAGLQLRRTGTAMLPLRSDSVPRRADRLRRDPARRARPRHRARRRHDLPRRAADDLGRDAGALQGRPREGRGQRLPDRRADPARRLRLARRGGAAAGARLRQRDRHRRADLLHLAADDDLGLRHQHGLDDRHRRGDRLLAVHPRPLPRGAGGGPRQGRRARRGALHLGPGGRPSPASP